MAGVAGAILTQTLGDLHAGKETDSFNLDVLRDRMASIPASLTRAHGKLSRFAQINVWTLGDLVEGEGIFPGQAAISECPLLPQAQAIHDATTALLAELHAMAPRVPIRVTGVPGNHGRWGGTDGHVDTNEDTRALIRLRDWSAGKSWLRVDANPRHFLCVPVGRWRAVLTHRGVKHLGTPAMIAKVRAWTSHHKAAALYHGHWHHADVSSVDDLFRVANGSLPGFDPYSESLGCYSPARQIWTVADSSSIVAAHGWHEWR